MSIAVTTLGTASNTSGATLSITVPIGGIPAGALIVVGTVEPTGTFGGSITDSKGNTYAAATHGTAFSSFTGGSWYAYNVAALVSGDLITFTKQTSGTHCIIGAGYATGIKTTADPLDNAQTTQGNGTVPVLTSGAPATTGELAIGFLAIISTSAASNAQASGFSDLFPTFQLSNEYSIIGSYATTTGSPIDYQPVTNASFTWVSTLALYKVPVVVPFSQAILIM